MVTEGEPVEQRVRIGPVGPGDAESEWPPVEPFDDAEVADGRELTRLEVFSGDVVNGLRATYGPVVGPVHGDEHPNVLVIDAAADPVVEISGTSGRYFGGEYLTRILVHCRSGQVHGPRGSGAYSTDERPFRLTAPPGGRIAVLSGTTTSADDGAAWFLSGLGAEVRTDLDPRAAARPRWRRLGRALAGALGHRPRP